MIQIRNFVYNAIDGATRPTSQRASQYMIQARRIGHATFDTPDLEKAIDYYTRVNGLALAGKERGRAFLATEAGMIAVELRENSNARCAALSFEVAPDTDFAALRRVLADEGIKSEERNAPAPGIARSMCFTDPNGTGIELFSEWTYGDRRDVTGVGPLKLGHVAFFAPDPLRLSQFYQRFLGFRISDWIEDFFVFMRCNADHHTVNFLRGDTPRMHHIAFELKDAGEICSACDVLTKDKIDVVWGPLRLGPG